jgi:hypothetical protein
MFVGRSFVVASGSSPGHICALDANETCAYRSWSVRLYLHARSRLWSNMSEDPVLRRGIENANIQQTSHGEHGRLLGRQLGSIFWLWRRLFRVSLERLSGVS